MTIVQQRQNSNYNDEETSNGKNLPDECDKQILELGYEPVFKREFGRLASFSFAFSISGLYATTATTLIFALQAGGAPALVWCWLIAGAGCMCIALSVAELVSAYPTSGGLYFTLKYLVPNSHIPLTSWICGWLNFLGQIAGVASTDYGCSQLLLAAISVGTNLRYQPSAGHTIGITAAIIILHGCINSLSTKWLDRITKWYAIFHLAALVSACITLLVCQKEKHSAQYVFVDIQSYNGWSPVGFSFLFGFLSVAWAMTDYDATAHIAEEIQNAAIRAPQAIASALLLTYGLGFIFNIVLAFTMGDINSLLSSPTGQPFVQLFYNVLGVKGGIVFTIFAFIILNFCGIAALQASARTVYAYSRDELLPFSRIWIRMNSYTQTPILAVWLNVVLAIGINLIGLGSTTAIVAIFNVCSIALDWSYCIPIICKLIYSSEIGGYIVGPWNLGKFSKLINICSVIWTLFVSIIFLMPTNRPVTPENMNYATVILVAILLFAMMYWYIGGARKRYIGPRTKQPSDKEKKKSSSSTVESAPPLFVIGALCLPSLSELKIAFADDKLLNIISSYASSKLNKVTLIYLCIHLNIDDISVIPSIKQLSLNLESTKILTKLFQLLPYLEEQINPFKNLLRSLTLIAISMIDKDFINFEIFQSIVNDFFHFENFEYYISTNHQPDSLFPHVEPLPDQSYTICTLPKSQTFDNLSSRVKYRLSLHQRNTSYQLMNSNIIVIDCMSSMPNRFELRKDFLRNLRTINFNDPIVDVAPEVRQYYAKIIALLALNLNRILIDCSEEGTKQICQRLKEMIPHRKQNLSQIKYFQMSTGMAPE